MLTAGVVKLLLTFPDTRKDGQQAHQDAQSSVDANENFVLQAGIHFSEVNKQENIADAGGHSENTCAEVQG